MSSGIGYFLDSSALVKRYAREKGTTWMLDLFRRAAGNRVYAARIAGVETAAALARKRRGHYSHDKRDNARSGASTARPTDTLARRGDYACATGARDDISRNPYIARL